jgi:hypothetical protein
MTWECARGCGQRLGVEPDGAAVCPACRALEAMPQGEAVRLFEPAPAQLAGQLGLLTD